MSMLRNKIIEEHIEKHYPNSRIVDYTDAESGLSFYTADQLRDLDEDWFPLSCHKDPVSGKAVYGGRKGIIHTYTEGETGAGKTTRFVMQSILALSSMKAKPSFMIVDIHGEIIENLYNHLKNQGYSIKILNCDNPKRSDTYNPLSRIAKEGIREKTITDSIFNDIRRISEIIQPVESKDDPIWDRGARSYTNGSILDKIEDLVAGDLPEDCLTIYNILQNHYWLREELKKTKLPNGQFDLFKLPHYKRKGTKALSTQKMVSATNNAEKTCASYFGVVENHYDTFGQPSLYSISSSSTIDIESFIEEPTVIVIQSGNTRVGDDLISLLVNDIYTSVVKLGKESRSKKLPRNIHCFLDEFANCNIAEGPEFIKMLTTSRKFGMFWHMILQCDAQLDRKYDPYIGRIIRANSTEIFMGSHDYETEVRFAESCGQKTIEALASKNDPQSPPQLNIVDLMTTERLNLTEEGYIYIKSARYPLMKTYIEAFYKCDEFVPADDIDEVYPENRFDYQQTSFFLTDLPPAICEIEYEFLKFIGTGRVSYQAIAENFPLNDVNKTLRALAQKRIIELLENHFVKANVTSRQMALYKFRAEIGRLDRFESAMRPTARRSRNPFDEDEDEDDNPFDFSPRRTRRELDTFDEWFDSVDVCNDPSYLELQEHIRKNPGIDYPAALATFTCIPTFLRKAVHTIVGAADGEDEEDDEDDDEDNFPKGIKVIKFEILEEYIGNHNFGSKQMWEKVLEEECDRLTRMNLFPKSLCEQFGKALRELQEELTLANVKEIKRILDEND